MLEVEGLLSVGMSRFEAVELVGFLTTLMARSLSEVFRSRFEVHTSHLKVIVAMADLLDE
jgi:hypothetical protein